MKDNNHGDHLTPDAILHFLDGGEMPAHVQECPDCARELKEYGITLKNLKSVWMPPPLELPDRRRITAMIPAVNPARTSSVAELMWITGKWLLLLSLACLMAGVAHLLYPHAARGIAVAYDGWGIPGLAGLAVVLLSIVSSPILVLLRNVQPARRSIYS